MNKEQDTILVTGATGQQGGATARALLADGYKVTAMTRSPDSDGARELAGLGAEVTQGDLDDESSLRAALAGAWGVFAVQNPWEAGVETEEEQGKRIARLAKEEGVQHFVYTSVAAADQDTGIPHFDNKYRIEETVRSLGFPSFVILRPVFFMENLTSPWYKPGIDDGVFAISLGADTELQMVAVADIGAYAKLAFEKHTDLDGQAIEVAGDELTPAETAARLGELAGREMACHQVPIDQIREMSEDFALMFEWFEAVGYSVDIAGNEERYGVSATSFEDWASAIDW